MRKSLSEVKSKFEIQFSNSKYLFILSHMRSRSSVLSHILGSNDGICGYRELHKSYVNYKDVVNMKATLREEFKDEIERSYLLDKILHNNQEISKKVVDITNPKFIFLLREPESTIKSIINMGGTRGNDLYKNPKDATNYYCSRLNRLSKLAEFQDRDFIFVDSDDLVKKTDFVLSSLTVWLGLESPLTSDYKIFTNTGKPSHGDPLKNILGGKLIKTSGYSNIEVPSKFLEKAQLSYEICKKTLTQR
ncbi:sulfotransferase family protein [Mangrovimonas sp. TPBH4]|uniref:sulfotransferase family protein n=1 Tax=Mangrovimonas sp. TPBH4 TaxID=1645914 RepID=UPI0012F71EDD|nr:sulfotransferase family protein [Mangrovimonas sp. TPBH4]